MQKPYEELELEVIRFDAEDVLTTSAGNDGCREDDGCGANSASGGDNGCGTDGQPAEVTHPEGYSEYSGTFNDTAGSRWMKETAYIEGSMEGDDASGYYYEPGWRVYVDEDGANWYAHEEYGWSNFYSD